MSDRRAFPRVAGTSLPSLSVLTGRSTSADIIDISDGGVLIETPVRVTPGDCEMVVLDANATIKKEGWVERVEITRLTPVVTYRTAIRFFAPISIRALTRSQRPVLRRASRETLEHFTHWARRLLGVHAVCVSSVRRTHPGTEPVHFAVPSSHYGDGRLLQVFFASGAMPTAAQFNQLRRMALLAADLPDLDIVSSISVQSSTGENLPEHMISADRYRSAWRKRLQIDRPTPITRIQKDGVVLVGAFPNARFVARGRNRKVG